MQINEITEDIGMRSGQKIPLVNIRQAEKTPQVYIQMAQQGPLAALTAKPEYKGELVHMGLATYYWELLNLDCQKALEEIKNAGSLLYRGASMDVEAYRGRSWQYRQASDTPGSIQLKVDRFLQSAGFDALRGNSVFVTGNYSQAIGYGDMLFGIFPVDSASITWNSKVGDFFNDIYEVGDVDSWLSGIDHEMSAAMKDVKEYLDDAKITAKEIMSLIKKLKIKIDPNLLTLLNTELTAIAQLPLQSLKVDGLELAKIIVSISDQYFSAKKIKYLTELLTLTASLKPIKDSSYLGYNLKNLLRDFRWVDVEVKDLKKMLASASASDNPADRAKKLGFVKDNLAAAIKSRKEIYLHGEYYAMNYSDKNYSREFYWFYQIVSNQLGLAKIKS